MRTFFALVFLIGLPCYAQSQPTVIRFGVLAELTGSSASNGEDCRRGAQIAATPYVKTSSDPWKLRIGEREVEIVVGDHAGEAKVGISEFKRMLSEFAVYAVVATRSQVAMPMNPLSAASGTPLLGSVGHPDFIRENPYSFRFYPSVEVEGVKLADLLHAQRYKSVALLSAEDEWTLALATVFKKTYQERGGIIKEDLTTLTDVPDLSSLVLRLARSGAEAVFVNLTLSQSGLAMRKLREQGYRGQIITNFWGANPDTIAKAGVPNVEGMLFSEVNLAMSDFRRHFNVLAPDRQPTTVAYVCYGAVSALLQTVKDFQQVQSKKEFTAALLNLKQLKLLDQEVFITEREVRFEVVGRRLQGGRSVPLQ